MRHRTLESALLPSQLLFVVVSTLSLLLPLPLRAASSLAPRLIVRVYDVFGTRPDELQRARDAVTAALHATDVDLHWRQCGATGATRDDACDDRPASNELIIRLLPGTATSADVPPHALGSSSVQTERHQGTFATVYPDRVRRLARQAGWSSGVLLGNAIAHEVGHLLLGTTDHPDGGLMRPQWTAHHTRYSASEDWSFQANERVEVRAAVRRRAPTPTAAQLIGAPTDRHQGR